MKSIFHKGEQQVQVMANEVEMATMNSRIIKDKIVRGAFQFIDNQELVVISSLDDAHRIWCSVLLGEVDFIKVRDEKSVVIDYDLMRSTKDDILFENIRNQSRVGLLFIDLTTRRRFRINGEISLFENELVINVLEAYPNCPKYIQKRFMNFKTESPSTTIIKGTDLGKLQQSIINHSDTFFIGSSDENHNMDASHRGGPKGFVEIVEGNTLKIPDYQGNSMFNTLGNFILNPNAGLIFIDFETGTSLQLTGKAELLFNQNSVTDLEKTTDTGRFWLFSIDNWIMTKAQVQANWEFVDYSPFNP